MKVISYSRIWKEEGAWLIVSHLQNLWISHNAHTLTWYQSLRVKGSIVFFLRPFLPFERRLFLQSRQTLLPQTFGPPSRVDVASIVH